MLQRFWHFLFGGHRWALESRSTLRPNPSTILFHSGYMTRDTKRLEWGSTELVFRCPCGSVRSVTIYGELTQTGQNELSELRKIAGLD